MDEDHLSPPVGKLIDTVRAELRSDSNPDSFLEAIALLGGDGTIFVGHSEGDLAREGHCGAAKAALAGFKAAGGREILAAALAASPSRDTVFPCPECRRLLAAVDPDLPMAVKQLGRWVLVPLSSLVEASSEETR